MSCCSGRRKKVAITFVLLSLLTLVVSVERVVFDVFGQMWGTMLINAMTIVCTITGMLGVCASEKIAIGLYMLWSFISVGLNIIVVLVYNDIGLLSQKEHYLGLVVGNDNWWRTHGINCRPSTTNTANLTEREGSGDLNINHEVEGCALSYALIETIHAGVYMTLAVVTMVLGLILLFSRQRKPLIHRDEDEEDFSYVSIAQWHDYRTPTRHHSSRRGGSRRIAPYKTTHVQPI